MYELVGEHVFPFLRALGGDQSTYAHHMRTRAFTIPNAGTVGEGRRHDRSGADGGARYQGRSL